MAWRAPRRDLGRQTGRLMAEAGAGPHAIRVDLRQRCGLEDHLYLPSGEMAKSNGELVDVAVRLCRDVGRRPATVDEARVILGLGGGAA